MREVYRAHDERLGRDVALKVVPELFAFDRERLARFEREARLLASLNHPHIAAIYDLEEDRGKRFLVLELVPGMTLSEKLLVGPARVDEALEIAIDHVPEPLTLATPSNNSPTQCRASAR